jgi:copper chaperone CopZ
MSIRKSLEPIWQAWENENQSVEEVMGLDVGNDKLLLIKIEGMHCHKCEQTIKKALARLAGVHEVEVDFPSRQASVLFDPSTVTPKQLTEAVAEAGYKVGGFTQSHADPASHS